MALICTFKVLPFYAPLKYCQFCIFSINLKECIKVPNFVVSSNFVRLSPHALVWLNGKHILEIFLKYSYTGFVIGKILLQWI